MKRGSALLIVLGMISFLVISAVAFSAYMRYQRLPSSYLRRTSSSRLLAKAALAQAIDQLDIALGNDPFAYSLGFEYNQGGNYAGEGYDSPRIDNSQTNVRARRHRRNFWRSHCYIGTNTLVDAQDTVSTLTLEGLAYLPPALINEARYYSRHSDGARWRSFGFDMGRYAYFAVDVSDHIDINRVFADMGRNSSDRGRISLAHVFEKVPKHDGYESSPGPVEWDEFMKNFLKVDDIKDGFADAYVDPSKLPLVSLADLNLAINDKQSGWVQKMSPFCYEVSPATRSKGSDYVRSAGSAESMMQMQMAFVTDSYFPVTNTSATADLAFVQPFTTIEKLETGRQLTLEEIIPQSTPVMERLKENLSGLDVVSLYDYLDGNDIPASLALPTTERVPMICGLSPTAVLEMQLSKEVEGGFDPNTMEPGPNETEKLVEHRFMLKFGGAKSVDVDALCLFPFHRNKEADQGVNYTVDFAARIGLTPRGKPLFRAPTQSAFVVPDKADFQKNAVENGVIKLYKQANVPPKNADVKDESQVAKKVSASFDLGDAENFFNNNPLFVITHKYVAEPIPNTDPPRRRWRDVGPAPEKPPTISNAFYPLTEDGRMPLGDFSVAKLLDGTAAAAVTPFMTVSARVKTSRTAGGAETVDLVPASVYDDGAFNNVNNADLINLGGDANSRPLVSVVDVGGNATLTFGEQSWSGSPVAQLKPSSSGGAFVCPDPRWNFAPENFYLANQELQEGTWFTSLCGVENQSRDCDVFMSVSNQGYLQSLAEIAMLPRTCDAFGGGDQMLGDAGGKIDVSANRDQFMPLPGPNDLFTALPHGFLMWRTYRLFAHDGLAADPIYDMDIVNSGPGFRISPFTTSTDITLAALANTPVSWWAASTNFTVAGKSALDGLGAEDFNRKYAFNAMAEDDNALFDWEKDLKNVAAALKSAMRRTDGNWEAGFNSLDWDYEDGLCGVRFEQTDPGILKDVDRKFLYGFWRECFANRQQLFLVFVRAEPTMMGGGAAGATPPALGARALALVWRDPTPTPTDVGNGQPRPHRTRVLFYRQFD